MPILALAALAAIAHAADVSFDVFAPAVDASLRCPGTDPLNFQVLAKGRAPNGETCSVLIAGTSTPGTILAIEGSVWSCEADGATVLCRRFDVKPPPAAPAAAAAAAAKPTGTTGTRQAGAPARRGPAPPPAAPLTRAELDARFAAWARLPDPGAAAALSGFVGFGAGHFYAHDKGWGVGLFVLQAAASIVAASGAGADDPEVGLGLTTGGLVGLGVLRIVDVATAPGAARRAALKEFGKP